VVGREGAEVEDLAIVDQRGGLDVGRDHSDVGAEADVRADARTAGGDRAKPAAGAVRLRRLAVRDHGLGLVAADQPLPERGQDLRRLEGVYAHDLSPDAGYDADLARLGLDAAGDVGETRRVLPGEVGVGPAGCVGAVAVEDAVDARPDGALVRVEGAGPPHGAGDRHRLGGADARHEVEVGLADRLGRGRAPAAGLDAGDGHGEGGLRRDKNSEVQDACLLHAEQDLALDQEHGRVRAVGDAELTDGAGLVYLFYGDEAHVVSALVEEVAGRLSQCRAPAPQQRDQGEAAGGRRRTDFQGFD